MGPLQPLHILYGLSCCSFVQIPLNMIYIYLLFTTKIKNVQVCFAIYVFISNMATTHNAIVTNTSWHLVSLSLAPLHFLHSAFHPRPAQHKQIFYLLFYLTENSTPRHSFQLYCFQPVVTGRLCGAGGGFAEIFKCSARMLACMLGAGIHAVRARSWGGRCTVVINHNIS